MRNFMMLLLSLVALMLPSVSSALDVYGQVHPQRYTFFLTPNGGNALKAVNDKTAAMLDTAQKGNMRDALTVNAIQKEGYDAVGIAPFYPAERSQSTIRDDGNAVEAVTCIMTTVTVPNSTRNASMDRTWCKDEVGAEYIGFSGWLRQEAVQKACRVGEANCPVYLSLQGDDPTVRNDSVRFQPTQAPKMNTARIDEIKANGCALANEAIQLETHQPGNCKAITGIETRGSGPDNITAHFVTTTGETNNLEVSFDTAHTRTVMVRQGGSFYSQRLKDGKWVCVGAYGKCF